MRLIDGKETAQYLKQHEENKNIPIVILTALSQSQIQEKDEPEKICLGLYLNLLAVSKSFKNLKNVYTV
ncbi:hypothetical protein [Trichormus azollae]|uniref:hypothetical protein n=1 Tax=Trichormus azollae TaxID=1164 RepID=UPI00325F6364